MQKKISSLITIEDSFLYILILIIQSVVTYPLDNDIKILFTAALIDQQYESRKREYIYSLNVLSQYGIEPYITEACATKKTFLDEYSTNVFYANTNIPLSRNKGVNEIKLLLAGLEHYKFCDDAMIIKLTGRYYFNTDFFINFVVQNKLSDAIIKLDEHGQVFCGCFAMRCSLLKTMLKSFDLISMEKNMINIELQIALFLKNLACENQTKIIQCHHLNITANIFGDGKTMLTHW